MAALYDHYLPEWRRDSFHLRYAWKIPAPEILRAHAEAKRDLVLAVRSRTGVALDPQAFTLGFARRAAVYKRADLLFTDPDRLAGIAERVGPVQCVFAGNAHPADAAGAEMIHRVFGAAERLRGRLTVVYVPDYEVEFAKLLCAGADIWLNTPQKPYEASGTSGMKAAVNGVPSLSTMDGWWIEGCQDGLTGWGIGGMEPVSAADREADALYDRLEWDVLPLYYRNPRGYAEVMRGAIALNGSFFNSHRMVLQYVTNAYMQAAGLGTGR